MFTQKKLNLRQRRFFELLKDYNISVLYHPDKPHVVVDDISCMTIGSMSHVEEAKKNLVKDVHRLARLGVRMEDSPNGGFMVHHNSKSSLVVKVKSKPYLDPLLMELEESVFGKLNELFSQGGMVCLGNKVGCMCRMLMI